MLKTLLVLLNPLSKTIYYKCTAYCWEIVQAKNVPDQPFEVTSSLTFLIVTNVLVSPPSLPSLKQKGLQTSLKSSIHEEPANHVPELKGMSLSGHMGYCRVVLFLSAQCMLYSLVMLDIEWSSQHGGCQSELKMPWSPTLVIHTKEILSPPPTS